VAHFLSFGSSSALATQFNQEQSDIEAEVKPCVSGPFVRQFINPFVRSQWGSGHATFFGAPSFTLFVLSEPHCFMKLHIGPCSHKCDEQGRLKTLHIRVDSTQVHTVFVSSSIHSFVTSGVQVMQHFLVHLPSLCL